MNHEFVSPWTNFTQGPIRFLCYNCQAHCFTAYIRKVHNIHMIMTGPETLGSRAYVQWAHAGSATEGGHIVSAIINTDTLLFHSCLIQRLQLLAVCWLSSADVFCRYSRFGGYQCFCPWGLGDIRPMNGTNCVGMCRLRRLFHRQLLVLQSVDFCIGQLLLQTKLDLGPPNQGPISPLKPNSSICYTLP